jgi:acyl-CoA thioesterase
METADELITQNIVLLRSRVEPAVRHLGIKLEQLKPGYAQASMKIGPQHLNFHGKVFGGIIMSLADHAFGYAANSLSYPSVASQFNVHFLESVEEGETLVATSSVSKSGRKISVSEIKITTADGRLVGLCTGTTVAVKAEKLCEGTQTVTTD